MQDSNLVDSMRTWNPGVPPKASSTATAMRTPHAKRGERVSFSPRSEVRHHCTATDIVGRLAIGRHLSPGRGGVTIRGGASRSAVSPSAQRVPPPLIDIHARLRGVILSSPRRRNAKSLAIPGGSLESRAGRTEPAENARLGLEPRGVERLGSHYSPAAQNLLIDPSRGCVVWRENGGGDDISIDLDAEMVADRLRGGGKVGSSDCAGFDSRGVTDETGANETTTANVRPGTERPGGQLARASSAPCDNPGLSGTLNVVEGKMVHRAPSGMQDSGRNGGGIEGHPRSAFRDQTQNSGQDENNGEERESSSSIDCSREKETPAAGEEQRSLASYDGTRGSSSAVGTAVPCSSPKTYAQSPQFLFESHRSCNSSGQRHMSSASPAAPSRPFQALGLVSPRGGGIGRGGDRRGHIVEASVCDSAAERYQAGLERWVPRETGLAGGRFVVLSACLHSLGTAQGGSSIYTCPSLADHAQEGAARNKAHTITSSLDEHPSNAIQIARRHDYRVPTGDYCISGEIDVVDHTTPSEGNCFAQNNDTYTNNRATVHQLKFTT